MENYATAKTRDRANMDESVSLAFSCKTINWEVIHASETNIGWVLLTY